jgi:hypothetical protein
LASDFASEPRWSMAAAAITPRWFDTAFNPDSFPGVSFIHPPLDMWADRFSAGEDCDPNSARAPGDTPQRFASLLGTQEL